MRHKFLQTSFVLLIAFFLLSFQIGKQQHIKVYLVGDSTIADKDSRKYPETGWGTPFKIFFDTTVTVENRAANGRSTRTFIAENRWQQIVDSLHSGDYVFIQFGHNDEAEAKKDRYTPPEDFKMNLRKFVTEAKSKGAYPVLLSPVTRRKFDSLHQVKETHAVYGQLTKEVAEEMHVNFIDLNSLSKNLLQSFGEVHSKLLFLHLAQNEHPNYPDGIGDNTHFSELGARLVAQLVIAEVKALQLPLAQRIYQPQIKSK